MESRVDWERVIAECLTEATIEVSVGRAPQPVLATRIGQAFHAQSWGWGRADPQSRRVTLHVSPPHPTPVGVTQPHVAERPPLQVLYSLEWYTNIPLGPGDGVRDWIWRSNVGWDRFPGAVDGLEERVVGRGAGVGAFHMVGFVRATELSDDETARLRILRAPVVALVGLSEALRDLGLTEEREPNRSVADERALTPRERQVLALLAKGLIAEAIAHRLNVSVRTVHCHLRHIYEKLGKHDRLSVVLHAQQAGLLGHGEPALP